MKRPRTLAVAICQCQGRPRRWDTRLLTPLHGAGNHETIWSIEDLLTATIQGAYNPRAAVPTLTFGVALIIL